MNAGDRETTMKAIKAVYKDGVFKPLEKVDLKNGEEVLITVSKKSSRGLSEALKKYVTKADVDLTRILIEERR